MLIRRLATGDLEQTQRLLQKMFGVIDRLPSLEPLLLVNWRPNAATVSARSRHALGATDARLAAPVVRGSAPPVN